MRQMTYPTIIPTAWLFLTLSAGANNIIVIDGDTIDLDGERVRIANIDAPETKDAQCDAELRLGHVAARRLAEILSIAPPALMRGDPADGRKKDRHGRTLGTITVNGRDVGEILISEELARPWQNGRRSWCNENME